MQTLRPCTSSGLGRMPPAMVVRRCKSPQLADDGSVDHWPEGFFDQFDRDMKLLRRVEFDPCS